MAGHNVCAQPCKLCVYHDKCDCVVNGNRQVIHQSGQKVLHVPWAEDCEKSACANASTQVHSSFSLPQELPCIWYFCYRREWNKCWAVNTNVNARQKAVLLMVPVNSIASQKHK